jgi:hypothetical protein
VVCFTSTLLALVATPVSATIAEGAQSDSAAVCELHVWGAGRPNFKPHSNFMVKIDPGQHDTSDPLSSASLYGAVNRAKALSDETLRKLLPDRASVRIVKHDEVIDLDKGPIGQLRGRLAADANACYADLVVGNLYAIIPNPKAAMERAGPIGAVLVGSDRLVIEFWLRDFSGPGSEPRIYKRKNDSPLPHVPPNSEALRAALEVSANANLQSFVDYVDRQRHD